jgi:UDP-N-acetylglucosamine 3-dehydrogenase
MNRPRILLCGAGNMGRNHLRVLGTLSECSVAGVVEPNERGQLLEGVSVYATLEQALEVEIPAAVVIATPTRTHYDLAHTLLVHRIPFLVEKPVAGTVTEGRALQERAARACVACMVGHIERFNPAVVAIRHLIRDGQLGDIVNIATRRVGGTPLDAQKAGDVLIDLAVHDIDIAQWLVGPIELRGVTGHRSPLIDSASMLFTAGEVTIDIHVNWITPIKIRSLSVTGTQGHIEANLITQQVTLTRKNPVLTAREPSGSRFFDDYLQSFAIPDQINIGIRAREPLREELRAFIAALGDADPVGAMPIPLAAGVSALGLAEAARTELSAKVAARTSGVRKAR